MEVFEGGNHLWFISPTTVGLMNGGYIELVHGDYKPTHNTIISLLAISMNHRSWEIDAHPMMLETSWAIHDESSSASRNHRSEWGEILGIFQP